MIWELFIDESGQFGDDWDDVVVAGIAIPRHSQLTSIALLDRFETRIPYVPFPPHAAHIRKPISYVIWHEAARQFGSRVAWEKSPQTDLCETCARVLRNSGFQSPFDRAVDEAANDEGRFDLGGDVYRSGQHLEQYEPTRWKKLKDIAQRVKGELRRCFQDAAESAESHPLFFSSEVRRGEGCVADGDRYLHLLKSLLMRVHDIFGRKQGEHEIWVYPLERSIRGRGALEAEDVEGLFDSVQMPNSVTLESPAVPNWTVRSDARCALADYAAHESRYRMQNAHGDLGSLYQSLTATLHVDIGARHHPNVSSGPTVAKELERERNCPTPDADRLERSIRFEAPGNGSIRTWAIEQAKHWLT